MPQDQRGGPEQYDYQMRQLPQARSMLGNMVRAFGEQRDQNQFTQWRDSWIQNAAQELQQIGGERATRLAELLKTNPQLVHHQVKQRGGWMKVTNELAAEQRQKKASEFLGNLDPEATTRQQAGVEMGRRLGDVRQGQAAADSFYEAGREEQRPTFQAADGYRYYLDGAKERVKPGIEKPPSTAGGLTGPQAASNEETLDARRRLLAWIQANETNRHMMRRIAGRGKEWLLAHLKDESEEGYAARLFYAAKQRLVNAEDPTWQPFLDHVVGIGEGDPLPRGTDGTIDRTQLVNGRIYGEGEQRQKWDASAGFVPVEKGR